MSKLWYSIRTPVASAIAGVMAADITAAAPEILIYKSIGENWYDEDPITAKQFRDDLEEITAPEFTVRILSMGGSVPDGLSIYNAIKAHPAKVTTINDGVAASVASLIFCAGDIRIASANSITMLHAPWTYTDGNAARLRAMADKLDAWAGAMAASYAEASGRSRDEIMAAFLTDGQDHDLTADQALEWRFATQVGAAVAEPAASALRDEILGRMYAARTAPNHPIQSPAAAAAKPQEPVMPNPVQTPAAPDAAAIRAEVLATDRARREAIRAEFAPFAQREGMPALMAQCQDDPVCDAAGAARRILASMASNSTPVGATHVETVEDESDKRRTGIVAALLTRAGVADRNTRDAAMASGYRGHTLLDLARASLDRTGISSRGMDKMQIVGAAFTQGTSDFPILLENAMHKALQTAYATAPDTWSRFCATGSVSDFRAHSRYRVGSLGMLDTLNELGEFRNKTIPDGEKGSITATTRGNVINISRQAIINDDLGAFVGLAAQLGRAGRRTIEAVVYALLAENAGLGPVLADGKTLFHADHGNITTGAALSMLAIEADRVAMASQTDVGGNDFLDLRPAAVVLPIGLGGTARSINAAEYDPDTANKLNKPNVVRGLFRDVVDTPRLTGTRRYLFADATEAPVIEVAFLDGNQEPYVEQEAGFTVDGTRYKARLDFGAAAIDYRGAVTNAGA